MTPLSPARIAPLLAATVATVRAEVRALGREASWRPAPGAWSVSECLGHLVESDRRSYLDRIALILAVDGVGLSDWDEVAVAAGRHDERADPIELVESFATQRSDGIALVRALSEADLGRVGIHPVIGPLSIGELLGEWVHHDREHVRQALAVTQARVWPQMGTTHRFDDPAG
ncbi:MAG: DinB family protein [Candidatus Limnocylindrales bacterium]